MTILGHLSGRMFNFLTENLSFKSGKNDSCQEWHLSKPTVVKGDNYQKWQLTKGTVVKSDSCLNSCQKCQLRGKWSKKTNVKSEHLLFVAI